MHAQAEPKPASDAGDDKVEDLTTGDQSDSDSEPTKAYEATLAKEIEVALEEENPMPPPVAKTPPAPAPKEKSAAAKKAAKAAAAAAKAEANRNAGGGAMLPPGGSPSVPTTAGGHAGKQ